MLIRRRGLSLLFIAWLFNLVAFPAQAARPGPLRCRFVAQSIGFPMGTATGRFICRGVVNDSGMCVVQYNVAADGAVQATKTLTGKHGTIVMQLTGTFVPTAELVAEVPDGQWSIVAGTGAYEPLRGRGRFRTRVVFDSPDLQTGQLEAIYFGWAVIR